MFIQLNRMDSFMQYIEHNGTCFPHFLTSPERSCCHGDRGRSAVVRITWHPVLPGLLLIHARLAAQLLHDAEQDAADEDEADEDHEDVEAPRHRADDHHPPQPTLKASCTHNTHLLVYTGNCHFRNPVYYIVHMSKACLFCERWHWPLTRCLTLSTRASISNTAAPEHAASDNSSNSRAFTPWNTQNTHM